MNRGPLLAVIAVVGLALPAVSQESDLEGAARSAAFRYESLIRRRAPARSGGGSGGPCDEVIGRFCFTFGEDDSADPPPEPEHPDVVAARRLAVRAFRAWLSREPHEPRAAGGLVRYLIEDDRPGEAVSVARTHVWANRSTGALLLLGLALHQVGDFQEAEAAFDSARALAAVDERERLDDVSTLLEPRERSAYRRLDERARTAYHRRFWALADPSLRTPGNERRSAHYARHAWIRILSRAPRAQGMLHWGDDHEEIVLRFGLPQHRERVREPAWRLHEDPNIIEYFDDAAVTFVFPALLTEGIPVEPEPGEDPDLQSAVPRALYTPIRLSRMRRLMTQVTRLPDPDGWTLRVDGMLPPDTADAPPVAPEGLLAVFDTLGHELLRAPGRVERLRDSILVVRAQASVPPGTYVYQLELGDDSSGVAGLARHRIAIPPGELVLSDPLIAAVPAGPLPRDRAALYPSPTRVLAPEQTVLVYAEARGLGRMAGTARYAVEWWLESRDAGGLLSRAFRWVGRRLGVAGESVPTRVRWEASADAADPVGVVFALDLAGVRPGLHRLGLKVVDRVTGREVTSYRTVRLEPGAVPLVHPGRD